MQRRTLIQAIPASLLLSASGASIAAADSYPSKPVKIIVPWPAGGPNDAVARVLAKGLSDELKQSFVVENRAGGNGRVGGLLVARAAPDGHTLLVINPSPLVINPTPQNPDGIIKIEDLTPISLVGDFSSIFVVQPRIPASNLRELVAYIKQHPGQLKVAVGGLKGHTHFMLEEFVHANNLNVKLIPYQGTAPAVKDILGGHVDIGLDSSNALIPHIKQGTIKAIAVAAPKRLAQLPDVSTTVEQGYDNQKYTGWFAFVGPGNLPAPIVATLSRATQKVTQSSDYKQSLAAIGIDSLSSPPEETRKFVIAERAHWASEMNRLEAHFQLK